MAKHQGLGKGLAALMDEQDEENSALQAPEFTPVETSGTNTNTNINTFGDSNSMEERTLPAGISIDEMGTLWVNPALLKPNPHQPRTYFDEEKLAELTESVRIEGVLSPIIIEDAMDGTFYIIAGERRTRAARAAGLEKVPVQLRKYSDSRKLEVALVENIQRTDLNPVEEAQAYYQIMEMEGISQEEVAQKVGKNRSTVANAIRLLKLPEDMLRSLASGALTAGHARALLSVINPADQRVLYGRIIGQGMSVRQAEAQAQELNGGSRANAKKAELKKTENRDPNYVAIEQKFIDRFGTKVQMKGNFEKGTIVIDYFTKDDLDRIYNLIIGESEEL